MQQQLNESAIRSRARRLGYRVCKSRQWKHVPHADNFGEYMLVDAETSLVVLGSRYDATLDEIGDYLREQTN